MFFNKPTFYPKQRQATNMTYKETFKQLYFTAGDEEQFIQAIITEGPFSSSPINPEDDSEWPKKFYSSSTARIDTFRYLFYKFKKGIFIQIRNGKLSRFLPFSNAHFVNEWYSRIKVPKELKQIAPRNGVAGVLPSYLWYANNYLVRYENPVNEGDTGHSAIKDMLETLCKERTIPDVDFFINRRDFPLVKKNSSEPYDAIFGTEQPLVSHSYEQFMPVLSMVEANAFEDIAIPTPDDWSRIRNIQGRYFMSSKRTIPEERNFCLDWEHKIPRAIFRGSSTGKGIGPENLRIKLCTTISDARIDAGLTGNSERYQIKPDGSVVKQQAFPTVPFMSVSEQSKYKYIINISGHVRPFRLSAEMAFQSVILLVGNTYRLWFEKFLVPWKHYVPVEDLGDLINKLDWCEEHQSECQQIAQNARAFYEEKLSKEGILDYLESLTNNIFRHSVPQESLPVSSISDEGINSLFRINMPIVSGSRCFLRMNEYPREKGDGFPPLNFVLRSIPNFVYSFSFNSIEKIKGQSLEEYCKGPQFVFEEWLCMLKHSAIALKVAQLRCGFVHSSCFARNVIIFEESSRRSFDYLVGEKIIRVTARRFPIFVDYKKSGVSEVSTFQDCISLLISSTYIVIKNQRLSQLEQTLLIEIFNSTICGSDVYYTKVNLFRELVSFIHWAYREPHLRFYPKVNVDTKDPMILYEAISEGNGWKFEHVKFIEKTHMGMTMEMSSAPFSNFKNPLLIRYALQQLWNIVMNKHRFREDPPKICIEEYCINFKYSGELVEIQLNREMRFRLMEMLADGGRYRLTAEEEIGIKKILKAQLNKNE